MANQFDGSSGYLTASSAVITAAPCTFAVWMRTHSTVLQLTMAVTDSTGLDNVFLLFLHSDGSVRASTAQAGSYAAAISSVSYSTNQWTHIAARFDASDSRSVFVNGINRGSNSSSKTPASLSATDIGRRNYPTSPSYFDGDLAEAAIWNVALNDDELAHLAAGFTPTTLHSRLPNLVLYQDLIRPLNHPGIGPTFSSSGGVTVSEHPPVRAPVSMQLTDFTPVLLDGPYRAAVGSSQGGFAAASQLSLTGAAAGDAIALGEVDT